MSKKKSTSVKPFVSIVIVHYRAHEALIQCLQSLISVQDELPFEVIIVDNDVDHRFDVQPETVAFLRTAKKTARFRLTILENQQNIGFGAANTVGVAEANAEYVFFLNPDTVVQPGCVGELYTTLTALKKDNPSTPVVVAPVLLDSDKQPYQLQGSAILTPLAMIGAHSLFHRVWPNNPLFRRFWLLDAKQRELQVSPNMITVSVVPGTAMFLSVRDYQQVGGFDPAFFLYFEEHDFGKRLTEMGGISRIVQSAEVIHHWGMSTQSLGNEAISYLDASRGYYLKKHYGVVGVITQLLVSLSAFQLSLFGVGFALIIIFGIWMVL